MERAKTMKMYPKFFVMDCIFSQGVEIGSIPPNLSGKSGTPIWAASKFPDGKAFSEGDLNWPSCLIWLLLWWREFLLANSPANRSYLELSKQRKTYSRESDTFHRFFVRMKVVCEDMILDFDCSPSLRNYLFSFVVYLHVFLLQSHLYVKELCWPNCE